MGIPGLWPFIENTFKETIRTFNLEKSKKEGRENKFDYVYFDANGLLHNAAQLVENYGRHKKMIDPFALLSKKEKEIKIFEIFMEDIINISSVIVPLKILYIAIDGTAPRAKQAQQRERRFATAKESENDNPETSEDDVDPSHKFNSSSISPGTEFMHYLSKFMFWKIREVIQNAPNNHFLKKIHIIYSPPSVPGEGEHKCLDYMRSLSYEEKNNGTHCIFGPDADLLMLTLSAHIKNIFLFREHPDYESSPGYYHLVNMSQIRYKLGRSMGLSRMLYDRMIRENDVSDEFILLGFFIGNDFLPKLKMVYRVDDGISKIIEDYNYAQLPGLITNKDKINFKNFAKLIKYVSYREEEALKEQVSTSLKIINSEDERMKEKAIFVDKTLLDCSKVKGNDIIIDINLYRQKYYAKAGISYDINYESNIMRMCKDYLRMVIWVYLYYTKTLPSWDNAYKWHYAPLMRDMSVYMNYPDTNFTEDLFTFDLSHPTLPFEQLLCILPPSSSNLLPLQYGTLLTDENSPIVKAGFCPDEYSVDYEGKIKKHMGVIMLPFVDYPIVENAYTSIYYSDEWKYHRNEFGLDYIFKWNILTKEDIKYESEYGVIENCKVYVRKL